MANTYVEMFLEKTLFWLACRHHILELILSAAVKWVQLLVQMTHYFLKFREYFNGLSDSYMESIAQAAKKIKIITKKMITHESFIILRVPS